MYESCRTDQVVRVCVRVLARQHGHRAVGVGHAEDEPGGGAAAHGPRALLPVGPQAAPAGALHRQLQAVPVVPRGQRLGAGPQRR